MPRIEIIPKDWETSSEKADGNGTPTIDVCHRCITLFQEGDPIDQDMLSLVGEMRRFQPFNPPELRVGDHIGSTAVEHPVFTEDAYECTVCGRELGWDDD